MKIKLNGEEKYLSTSNKKISLKDTINLLGYKPNTIVVELNENEKTVKKQSFSKNFNYSNLTNKFELKKYQEDVETNLINSIARDIKIFLN